MRISDWSSDVCSSDLFAAHAERHGDGLRIVSDHCPFGGAAIEHPVICAVDRGLVRGMLGALYGDSETSTLSSRPSGDDRCITGIADGHAPVELGSTRPEAAPKNGKAAGRERVCQAELLSGAHG